MPSNRLHIQLYRNPSATTFSNASELEEGEIAVGLKPNHEKMFVKNSRGDIASFSSDAALNSLRSAMGISVGGDANDESSYSTQIPYLSNKTTMADALDVVAMRAKYSSSAVETNFQVDMVTETSGLDTIVSPKFSFDISVPVDYVSVIKVVDGISTNIYTGNTSSYSGDVTITNVKEYYVLEFVPSNSPCVRIQEILPLNVCCVTSCSDDTITSSSTADINYNLVTGNEFSTELTTESGGYVWVLVPFGVNVEEVSLDGMTIPMESTPLSSLDVEMGAFKCYRSTQRLNLKTWNAHVKLSGIKHYQMKNISATESFDADIVTQQQYVYGTTLSYKPNAGDIVSILENLPDSNKKLTVDLSKSKTFLDMNQYYLYAVPGVQNFIVRHNTTDGAITECPVGYVWFNQQMYSYVVVEKASIPWYFKIDVDSNNLDESLVTYGIEYDKTSTDPDCTRIGNMEFHKTLPIQSQMRGCLLDDDGNVVKYLPDSGWTEETLDGTMGQVMVELPEFWWKFSESGDTQTVMLSIAPLNGYKKVNKTYVSAYEATFDRGNDASGGTANANTWKMASVKNSSTRYRGGNNDASRDSDYNTMLGMAGTSRGIPDARNAARRRKPSTYEWNVYTYQQHKEITWLYVVEYATRNSQKPVSATTTEEGYKQGGIGYGVAWVDGGKWNTFNGNYPFVPIGVSDSLGNGSGQIPYISYSADGESWVDVNVPRYRGIEHPFGHIYKSVDGIKIEVVTGDEGESQVYLSDTPSSWSGNTINNAYYVGNEVRSSNWTQEIFFGENGDIWATKSGGDRNTYFCDKHTISIGNTSTRPYRVGRDASGQYEVGLFASDSTQGFGYGSTKFGFRLSFIPNAT